MKRLVTLLATAAVATALAGSASAATDPSLTTFKQKCAVCHTLAAAKAKGTIGANLDKTKPKYAIVVARVTNGKGAMPKFKGQLTTKQIAALAKWVSSNYKK